MTVTAKFKVSRLTPWNGTIIDGAFSEDCTQGEVEMTPDYANGRNAEWSAATPNGVIRLGITNVDALHQFRMNNAYTVTFEVNNEA